MEFGILSCLCDIFEHTDIHTLFIVSLTFILPSFGVLYLSHRLSHCISVSYTFFEFLQTFPEYLRLQKASSVHEYPHQLQLYGQQPLSIILQHKAFMDREAFHLRKDFPDVLRLLIQQFLGYSPVHFCPLACNVKTNIHGTNFTGLETISRLIKPLPQHPVWYEFKWNGEHYITFEVEWYKYESAILECQWSLHIDNEVHFIDQGRKSIPPTYRVKSKFEGNMDVEEVTLENNRLDRGAQSALFRVSVDFSCPMPTFSVQINHCQPKIYSPAFSKLAKALSYKLSAEYFETAECRIRLSARDFASNCRRGDFALYPSAS